MQPSPPPFNADAPDPARRIVVAGLGLITPLGHGAWATFSRLLQGQTISDRLDGLEEQTDTVPMVQAIGGVSVARHTRIDPTVELAERAAREAATEAGVELPGLATWLGTSKGAVGAMGNCGWPWPGEVVGSTVAEAVALGPHGYLNAKLNQRTGVSINGHTVAACASSLTALHHARQAMLHRDLDTAMVVSSEAALLPLFIHSYRRLGVLAPTDIERYRQCPLDESRHGFVLSEVGVAVVLKRIAKDQPLKQGQIELLDTAIATEAQDLIRPAAGMPALRHIASQLLSNRDVAALHPHAPGTAEHDPTELQVLHNCLSQDSKSHPPAIYANKGALGHSLGSAGLVSFVIAALTARAGKVPPMPWLKQPLADAPLPLSATPTIQRDSDALHAVFAAGFGGHTAGATLRRISTTG